MMFDDLPLDRSRGPDGSVPPSRPPSILRWILAIAGAMVAGALLTFWWMSRTQPEPVAPPPTAPATDVPLTSNRPAAAPIVLPNLESSDSFLRDLVSKLSQHPTLARLLATRDLVRRSTLAVVQVGDGKTPATPLAVLRPESRLRVAGGGESSGAIDPASYERWNPMVAALTSIDPAEAAQLYVNVKPLFDEAYRELGQGGDFDVAIRTAIETLSATPDVSRNPVLLRRPGYFEHQDDALRALRPVQKQFLLIGPDNRARVIAWLRQVADNLDIGG